MSYEELNFFDHAQVHVVFMYIMYIITVIVVVCVILL